MRDPDEGPAISVPREQWAGHRPPGWRCNNGRAQRVGRGALAGGVRGPAQGLLGVAVVWGTAASGPLWPVHWRCGRGTY